ncbi:MAG: hypothetical protein AAF494_11885 [Pseudomonadota bacterium]
MPPLEPSFDARLADTALGQRIARGLKAPVNPAIAQFASALAEEAGAKAVLFYGSNLRTGSLDGVLDFYVLLPGPEQSAIWPRVSYHERDFDEVTLRAKVATMSLQTFAKAASGALADTTIWARFVQPSALVWVQDDEAERGTIAALSLAATTAARLAVALGPEEASEEDYWRGLFRATYQAELRVEQPGREDSILSANAAHFSGLLPLALDAGAINHAALSERLKITLPQSERRAVLGWWRRRRRLGKPLNVLRLAKASVTFAGGARYAAWKIKRHSGIEVTLSPLQERFALLAAPAFLAALRQHRRASDKLSRNRAY